MPSNSCDLGSSTDRCTSSDATARGTRSRANATSLRLLNLRQNALLHPQVHKRLHWLSIFLAQQVVQTSDVNKVNEASVELAVTVEIPEGEPVLPVQVCVAAEHLLVHVLDLSLEALREAGRLAEPVVGVGLCLCLGWNSGSGSEGVHREQGSVENFAADPGLNVFDVSRGRKRHRVAILVDPGVVVAFKGISVGVALPVKRPNLRACGHGRTSLGVANRRATSRVHLLDNLEHATKDTVLLGHCMRCQQTMHDRAFPKMSDLPW